MPIWYHLVGLAVIALVIAPAFRFLDGQVTRVRAQHGLAMAWGTAILGFAVIIAGIGVIAWVGVMLAAE